MFGFFELLPSPSPHQFRWQMCKSFNGLCISCALAVRVAQMAGKYFSHYTALIFLALHRLITSLTNKFTNRALDLHSRGSGINAHHVHSFSSGRSVEVEYAKMRSFRAPFGLRSGTHEHMPTDDVNRGSDDARRSGGRTEEIWNISDNEISTQVV